MTFDNILAFVVLWYGTGLLGSLIGVHFCVRGKWVAGDYIVALLGPCNLLGALLAAYSIK